MFSKTYPKSRKMGSADLTIVTARAGRKKEMTPSIDVFGSTDTGRVREKNEDQYVIADIDSAVHVHQSSVHKASAEFFESSPGLILLVADGVGGASSGEKASRIAAESVIKYLVATLDASHEDQEIARDLNEAVQFSESQIQKEVRRDRALEGMATTLTMGLIRWPWAYVAHVGDSRCYLLRDRQLFRVTKDHTLAEELRQKGDGKNRFIHENFSHVLVNCIGGKDQARPDVHKMRLEVGDMLLLCTDGLTNHVVDDQISSTLLNADSARVACRELVRQALEAGGTDNVTTVVMMTAAK